jgi:hypothetical protein
MAKYKHFGLKSCSLMLNFGYHSLWNDIYFLKYFLTFSRPVEATTQAEMDIGESHGCTATNYLITKLQC